MDQFSKKHVDNVVDGLIQDAIKYGIEQAKPFYEEMLAKKDENCWKLVKDYIKQCQKLDNEIRELKGEKPAKPLDLDKIKESFMKNKEFEDI
jgi:hypothetical protein